MRLISLQIKNFRSVRDSGEFPVKPLFALVGENNTGKSNVLRAVDVLLSAGAGKLSREDFNQVGASVIIKGVFGDLLAAEKKRWSPYCNFNLLHVLQSPASLLGRQEMITINAAVWSPHLDPVAAAAAAPPAGAHIDAH